MRVHPALMMAVLVALIVNLLTAAAFVWSRPGQATVVAVEARGERIEVWVDGRLFVSGDFPDGPRAGGILLRLEDTTRVPSLPQPRGFDHVTVTNLGSGETLFEDDFSGPGSADWTRVQGQFSFEEGALGVVEPGTLWRAADDWTDYRVTVRYRNIQGAAITVRSPEGINGATFTFRPFRHNDSNLVVTTNALNVGSVNPGTIELSKSEVLRSMLAMWTRFYPVAIVTTLAVLVAVLVVQFVPAHRLAGFRPRWTAAADSVYLAPLAFVVGAAFLVTLFLNYSYGSRMPHVPDEVSYLFQADLLASGRFTAPPSPIEESFEFFYPPLITLTEQGRASVYPFGHPLVLSAGQLFGAPWIVPPLIGAACVAMMYAFGSRVYERRVGLLAAALLMLSPFFMMTASNFMSHNTAALYLLVSLFFLATGERRLFTCSVLAGVFFGLLFNTRPLTSFALVPPFGVMLLSGLLRPERRHVEWRRVAGFVAGGLLMVLAYWVYNYFTTGSFLQPGYETGGDLNQAVGFGGAHSVARGIQNEQTQLAFLVLIIHNWPLVVGMMFVMLPFLLGTMDRWDWFCLACAVFIMGAWAIYEAPGIAHGPRYWYESLPFLVLLAARGADRLGTVTAAIATWARERAFDRRQSAAWAGVAIAYALILALAVQGSYEWLRGDGGDWRVDQMPARAEELKGYNGADDRLLKLLDDAELENALVLVERCPNWQCYGTVFLRNTAELDGPVVLARDVEARNPELFDLFPDRRVYRATYISPSIVPFGSVSGPGDEPPTSATPPRAEEIPDPTPAPSPTPDVERALERDEVRRGHLDDLVTILNEFYAANERYPEAREIQTLCVYDFDAACELEEIRNPLPRDPLGRSYWYQSDGVFGFSLYASMELPQEDSGCPEPIPGHLAGTPNLYCQERAANLEEQSRRRLTNTYRLRP
jgi:hypothetical protein